MKKAGKIIGITLAVLVVIILASILIIPVAFKGKIKAKVESTANDMLNARVSFADYKLSLIKAFPNASFTLKDLSIVGTGNFEGDTLAAVKSLSLVFNLASIFSGKGYEIKSIAVDEPLANAIVLKDGSANWDIMKETETQAETEAKVETESETGGTSSFKMQLRQFTINDGRVRYTDNEAAMAASIEDLSFILSGNMSTSVTELLMDLKASKVDFTMDNVRYLSSVKVDFHAGLDAQLDSMLFVLKDNSFRINDITLNWAGKVSMPGEDIGTDLKFNAPETSFKSLLSMVPAVYMEAMNH